MHPSSGALLATRRLSSIVSWPRLRPRLCMRRCLTTCSPQQVSSTPSPRDTRYTLFAKGGFIFSVCCFRVRPRSNVAIVIYLLPITLNVIQTPVSLRCMSVSCLFFVLFLLSAPFIKINCFTFTICGND